MRDVCSPGLTNLLLGVRQPGAMPPQAAGQKKSFQTMQEMSGMSGMDHDHHKEVEVIFSLFTKVQDNCTYRVCLVEKHLHLIYTVSFED